MVDGIMTSTETPAVPKEPASFYDDRVGLKTASVERIRSWLDQALALVPGIRLTKADLVNWLIAQHAPELLPHEVNALQQEFFDEVRFAEWAVRELKARKARGESVTLASLMADRQTSGKATRGRKPKQGKELGESPSPDLFRLENTLPENSLAPKKLAKMQGKPANSLDSRAEV